MREKLGSPLLLDITPQEVLIVALGTVTMEPLGSDTKSEASQGNQRFPRTVSPPKPGDGPIYTFNNPQALFPHSVTKLHPQAPTPGTEPTVSSSGVLIM